MVIGLKLWKVHLNTFIKNKFMENGRVFILSVSSDIGHALALEYLNDGYEVVGTYRNIESVNDLLKQPRIKLLYCDISYPESIRSMINDYGNLSKPWDIFISSIGTLEPIGPFFSADFNEWEEAVTVNSLAQLRVLHNIWPYRRQGPASNVVFFAGGGTNSPFTNYSAYAASKVFLIKMCELLDDENQELNVFIVGPGFIPTKIHKTIDFLKFGRSLASYGDIYDCINWCIAKGKNIASGRNFSVVHDSWREDVRLVEQLRRDTNKFKLRRFRNEEE